MVRGYSHSVECPTMNTATLCYGMSKKKIHLEQNMVVNLQFYSNSAAMLVLAQNHLDLGDKAPPPQLKTASLA